MSKTVLIPFGDQAKPERNAIEYGLNEGWTGEQITNARDVIRMFAGRAPVGAACICGHEDCPGADDPALAPTHRY